MGIDPREVRRASLVGYYESVATHPLATADTKKWSRDKLSSLDDDLTIEGRFPLGVLVEVESSLEGYGWMKGWLVLQESEGKVTVGHAAGVPGRLQRTFSRVRLPSAIAEKE
jgi:hypothetical protein